MSSRPAKHIAVPANGYSAVPVKNKFANRFYEPIVVLVGLNEAWKNNRALNSPEVLADVPQSSELAFHYFLNKLGQLCDSKRGGETVTAFVVLQFPDRVQYRFASNQRKAEDLILVKDFVCSLLQDLGKAQGGGMQEKTSHILRKSLSFTKPRVGVYVRSLKENVTPCIAACIEEDTPDSKLVLGKLKDLSELLQFEGNGKIDNITFAQHCETLIIAIERLYQSNVEGLIRLRTKEDRMDESKCWCELRHATGRLLSYLHAVKVLISARKLWPELFEEFEVCPVVSSTPAPNPLRNACKVEEMTVKKILGRMTSNPEVLRSYRASAEELQKCGLDEKIQKQTWLKAFRPIVHAEVLLLDSLERDGGTHSSRFFHGYRYIGCGKPTCRLCDYYFKFHSSGVEVRPGHRNLYPNWRVPDVYSERGTQADKDRENIMNLILNRIRDDLLRTLREKVPQWKPHDSNTEPTSLIDSIQNPAPRDMEQLTSAFKQFGIGYPGDDEGMRSLSRRASFAASDMYAEESDYNEESGGVLL